MDGKEKISWGEEKNRGMYKTMDRLITGTMFSLYSSSSSTL
jgi:hypothetical protein